MQNDEENILIDWLLLIEQLMNGEITQAYYDSKVYGDCDARAFDCYIIY